jgi:hypothetical protein
LKQADQCRDITASLPQCRSEKWSDEVLVFLGQRCLSIAFEKQRQELEYVGDELCRDGQSFCCNRCRTPLILTSNVVAENAHERIVQGVLQGLGTRRTSKSARC